MVSGAILLPICRGARYETTNTADRACRVAAGRARTSAVGIGSYLTLLQEKLAKGDFDKIASLVPGASGYLETAKKLGAVTGPLNNLKGLNGALGKLGMNADTVAQFTPLVTNYLGKAGGPTVQNLLAGALK